MSSFSRLKNRLIARLITRFPELAKGFIDSYRPWESEGAIPWTQPPKALRDCRLALVTTAGVHHASQPPFDMQDSDGDPSFRELAGASIAGDYRITHDYYDHSDAEKDLNIILPLQRLQEFVTEGLLGSLNHRHFSFMGHIDGRHIPALIEGSARKVAGKLCSDEVDLVLLTPA
jgi:D-proline reductase (dithiol) PrdB